MASSAAPDSGEGWLHVAQQLEAENRTLTAERDYWKGEAERYHAGLERAVAVLNRERATADLARLQAALVPPRPAPSAARVWSGVPWLQVVGDTVLATGHVYNYGADAANGTLYVDLLFNNRVVDTKKLALEVPAGSTSTYSAEFHYVGDGYGTFAARARPVVGG